MFRFTTGLLLLGSTTLGFGQVTPLPGTSDSARGGFTEKFAFIDTSRIYAPGGSGPLGLHPARFETAGLRFIKRVPAPGVHPRLLCNPEDVADVRARLINTASGRAIARYIHVQTVLLQLGYGNGGAFNINADYAKNGQGQPLLVNVGYANVKPLYDSLALGDIGRTNNYSTQWGGSGMKMAAVLANEAFECWLYRGTTDPVTRTAYTDRATRLARAITIWATKALADPTLSYANREKFGSLQMAFVYDFLYDQLTTDQRNTIRKALIAIALNKGSQLHLYDSPSYTITSNWATFGYEIMPLLAIEGEPGYTSIHDDALRTYCRVLLNFLNYGVYHSTGQPYEGIGKNQLNIPLLVMLARRGYSLLGHPALKAFGTRYYPAIMQPFGYSFLGNDLLGGTGFNPAYGGWRHNPSDIIGYKWIYPADGTIDFMWRNYIQTINAGVTVTTEAYQYQDVLANALGQPGYWNSLYAALFASDYSTTPFNQQLAQVYANRTFYADSLGGLVVMRSGTTPAAATLFFHNRTDLGGHTFSNRNDIVFSGLGRIWIPRIMTNANTSFYQSAYTGASSGILINNQGASADTTVGTTQKIIAIPGKLISFGRSQTQPASELMTVCGDAQEAYSYVWRGSFGGYKGDNPFQNQPGYEKVMTTLNSYRYARYGSIDDIPLYDQLTQGDYAFDPAAPNYNRYVRTPYRNGLVQKVSRTVAMVGGTKPYVLIADDVRRDGKVNNYKWVAQLASDLTVDSVVVDAANSRFRNDLILKEPATTGNRRLLVRVLNNTGAVSSTTPATIDFIANPVKNLTPNDKLPRLIIESNSVEPGFKVLLYPFTAGEPLPITGWNGNRDALTVINGGLTETVVFSTDAAGRTNIRLQAGGTLITANPTEPPASLLQVAPNPVQDTVIRVQVNGLSGDYVADLTDETGRVVRRQQGQLRATDTQLLIPHGVKKPGIYLLHIQVGNYAQTLKVVLW